MHIPITGLLRSIPASEYTVNRKTNFGNSAPACHTYYLIELNLVPRVLSYPLRRVGRREPWERGWIELCCNLSSPLFIHWRKPFSIYVRFALG